MSKISSSPDRGSFQRDGYIKRCEEEGKEPSQDYLNFFKTIREQDEENMNDPEWREDNLEYDLRSTDWIVAKAHASKTYAQNIYAALCNMRWQRHDILPILKDQYWSCSWRSAGGIVADMLGKGDYIDWYCSGMGGLNQDYQGTETNEQWRARTGYVPEGNVTPEIEHDFFQLGWTPSPWPDDTKDDK